MGGGLVARMFLSCKLQGETNLPERIKFNTTNMKPENNQNKQHSIQTLNKLKFFFGGYSAANFVISIEGNIAVYSACMYSPPSLENNQKKEVLNEDLERFKSKLNQLNVLQWENEYMDNDILDGLQWELEILYNKSEKKTICGSNCYPGSPPDSSIITPIFEELLDAIIELIQEPKFFSDEFYSK